MVLNNHIEMAKRRIYSCQIGQIDPDKPTLVLLHGAIDCIDMWRDFPQQLHEISQLAVIVYDRWGHGKSEPLAEFREGDTRIEEADEPLDDLFEHYGLEKVILVGHSYGGVISLIAASHHPERIIGIVSIVPQMLIHNQCVAGLEVAKTNFEEGDLRAKLIKFHGDGLDVLFYDWVNRVYNKAYQQQDCSEYLAQITCPVLQIYGEDDEFGYLPNLELSKEHIKSDLSIKKFANAGHYVHLEAKNEVINDIKAFCLSL